MTVIKLRSRLQGDHIHEQVFAGPDHDHLALLGELRFPATAGEWQLFGAALLLGAHATQGHLEVVTEGDLEVVEQLARREQQNA